MPRKYHLAHEHVFWNILMFFGTSWVLMDPRTSRELGKQHMDSHLNDLESVAITAQKNQHMPAINVRPFIYDGN